MSEKSSWPEVKDLPGEKAKEIIAKETAGRNIEIIICAENSPCTMDYRTDRCRIFVDANQKVVAAPNLG